MFASQVHDVLNILINNNQNHITIIITVIIIIIIMHPRSMIRDGLCLGVT